MPETEMFPTGDRAAITARYLDGPALLERAVASLGDADLDAAPAQGGWTIRQITHHVADGDDLWKTAVKMACGADRLEFALGWYWAQPQDAWAGHWAYARRSLDESLALLRAARAHVRQLLEQAPAVWDRTVLIRKPDGDTVLLSVGAIVEMQADHVEHHVKRIAAIRGEPGVL